MTTVLTGPLQYRSAVHGALAQIEALGLELIEVRRSGPSHRPGARADRRRRANHLCSAISPTSGEGKSPGSARPCVRDLLAAV